MSSVLQVCIYNADPDSAAELRAQISALNFVRLCAEPTTPEELSGFLHNAHVNLIFFHLDPNPSETIDLIDQVATRFPETALIALGAQKDPAAILAPIRAGCEQYVCMPIEASDLATAVSRVASKRLLARAKSRCIVVVGATGGAGATSVACNLALEMAAQTQKPCALVDLGFQFGDVAMYFDSEPKYTFADLADTGGHIDRTMLSNVMCQLPCQVALLARPNRIEQAEHITPDAVHHAIDLLKTAYESVVIDMPRYLEPSKVAALEQADHVLIVCQLLIPSIRNATRYQETLHKLGIPEERIHFVLNREDSNGGRVTVKELESSLHQPLFASIPNDFQYVSRSLDLGRPLSSTERKSPVRTAIAKMAKRLIGDTGEKKPEVKKGLFSRMLAK